MVLLTTDNTGSRMDQKEKRMQRVMTEHEEMMVNVMQFTSAIVVLAEMRDVPPRDRAEAIFMAEQIFHKMIMDRMIEKCANNAVPCNN